MRFTSAIKLLSLAVILSTVALFAGVGIAEIDDDESLMVPEAFLDIGSDGSFAILVEKSSSTVEIYQKRDRDIVKVASYRTSTGRVEGDKLVEGDLKTPEGVYYLVRIREDSQLLSKYGIRAFDLNYPNQFDRIDSKTGHGIWLHGTDEPERLQLPHTSEGCVVVSNEDLTEISDYITLYRTPVIISDSVKSITKAEAKDYKERVNNFILKWLDSWANQDFGIYNTCYIENFRGSKRRAAAWLYRKKMVFQNTSDAKIDISDLKILKKGNHYTVSFYQRYKSNLMDDTGIKWVYISDTEKGLKILSEEWFSVNKALNGDKWNRKRTRIVEVVEDIADIDMDGAGKLRISDPTVSFPFRVEEEMVSKATPDEPDVAEKDVKPERMVSMGNSPIAVDGFRIIENKASEVNFAFKLVNKGSTGELRRGKLIMVAEFNSGSFTSFPEVVLDSGIPVGWDAGDRYGIKWFKDVAASFRKPDNRSTLQSVRCYIFDNTGRLISDTELWKAQGD